MSSKEEEEEAEDIMMTEPKPLVQQQSIVVEVQLLDGGMGHQLKHMRVEITSKVGLMFYKTHF